MGEPHGRLLKRRHPPPDWSAKTQTVRELLDRRAGQAAQGHHNELREVWRRAGAPFFFGDFLLWRAKRKSPVPGAAPRRRATQSRTSSTSSHHPRRFAVRPRPAYRAASRQAFAGSDVRRHIFPRPESLHGFGRSRARTHAGASFEFPAHPGSPSGRRGISSHHPRRFAVRPLLGQEGSTTGHAVLTNRRCLSAFSRSRNCAARSNSRLRAASSISFSVRFNSCVSAFSLMVS